MTKSLICFLLLPLLLAVVTVQSSTAFLLPSRQNHIRKNDETIRLPTPSSSSSSSSSTSLHPFMLFAKKGKKKSKNSNTKQSGFEWASSFTLKPFEAPSTRELVATAVASFQGRTGKPLCDEIVGVADIPKALWKSPLACVVVKNQPGGGDDDDDGGNVVPVVQYANIAALETVGLTADRWDQLMISPDPKKKVESASPTVTLDLPGTMEKAYESGYQKKIIRKNHPNNPQPEHDIGVKDAQRWKLERSILVNGKFVTTELGIAYTWEEWVLDDSIICSPGGERREVINVDDLQQQIEDQAAQVRSLKQDQGLTNKDPQVQDAVAELLRLKATLEAINQ